jgi:TonB family protein
MSAMEAEPSGGPVNELAETANERLKRSFGTWLWGSMIAAALVHFSAFAFWPQLSAKDISFQAKELESITLPPDIEIPPPPKAIARPATPVIASTNVDEDITIAPTTFEENPVENLPPPPAEKTQDLAAAPTFTPYTVAPSILNRAEVQKVLEEKYPPLLRDAGIGGTVRVYFFIDETGKVIDRRIDKSSGHKDLDDAALQVAAVMRFSPALNRDKKVPVWVSFPITFVVH